MRRMISWLLVGMMVLSGCASSTPPPMETETDTSEPERIPEILSSFKPGDRIEVWAASEECFEAEFVAFESSNLIVRNKTYKRTYQRDDKHHRSHVEYGVEEITRVRMAPPLDTIYSPRYSTLGIVVITAIATTAAFWIMLSVAFRGLGG